MVMLMWRDDLFSVACYVCARVKLHATFFKE